MTRGARLAVAAALLLLTAGCAPLLIPRRCADGLPVRLLIDVACPRGVCGYTCAPDRWRAERRENTWACSKR